MVRLHIENQLHSFPGSASKVFCGGWVVVGGWWVESKFSDRLWLSSSLDLAKPSKRQDCKFPNSDGNDRIYSAMALVCKGLAKV